MNNISVFTLENETYCILYEGENRTLYYGSESLFDIEADFKVKKSITDTELVYRLKNYPLHPKSADKGYIESLLYLKNNTHALSIIRKDTDIKEIKVRFESVKEILTHLDDSSREILLNNLSDLLQKLEAGIDSKMFVGKTNDLKEYKALIDALDKLKKQMQPLDIFGRYAKQKLIAFHTSFNGELWEEMPLENFLATFRTSVKSEIVFKKNMKAYFNYGLSLIEKLKVVPNFDNWYKYVFNTGYKNANKPKNERLKTRINDCFDKN